VAVGLLAAPGAAQPELDEALRDWPFALASALEAYFQRDYGAVRGLCLALPEALSPQERRAARALAAMASLRSAGREERLQGRGEMARLVEEDPRWQEQPDCALAYGAAQLELQETASAIYHLRRTVEGFEARQRPLAAAEASVALCDAWLRHTEWESPPPGMNLPRPASADAADAVRIEQITEARRRVEHAGAPPEALDRIDLALAEALLRRDATRAEGRQLERRLTEDAALTPAVTQACLRLAREHTRAGRWSDALALLKRVAAAEDEPLRREAQAQMDQIEAPALDLRVLDSRAVAPVRVRIETRNLTGVSIEARRIDLPAWLEQRRGELVERELPEAGSLVYAETFRPAPGAPHDPWSQELTFPAPPGAYALVARSDMATGGPAEQRRLLIVSDVEAAAIMGPARMVVWTPAGAPGAAGDVRFWVHGSFVARQARLVDGVAVFDLPPDTRVLTSRRWTCLVQVGGQFALCAGLLHPAATGSPPPPIAALVAAPPQARLGGELAFFGRLLAGGWPVRTSAPNTADIELQDARDRVVARLSAPLDAVGCFSARVPVSEAMTRQNLRALLRVDGQAVELAGGALQIAALSGDETPLIMESRAPAWTTDQRVPVELAARYPWRTPLAAGHGRLFGRTVRLPTNTAPRAAFGHLIMEDIHLSDAGRERHVLQLDESLAPETFAGPLALGLWSVVSTWDNREAGATCEALIGPRSAHLWIAVPLDARVGAPVEAQVRWFDPSIRLRSEPRLSVRRGGEAVAAPRLFLSPSGYVCEPWWPAGSGDYELLAQVDDVDGETHSATAELHVAAAPGDAWVAVELNDDADDGGPTRTISVRVTGECGAPLLILLADSDVLAARSAPRLSESAEFQFELPRDRRPSVTVAAWVDDRFVTLASTSPPPAAATELELRSDEGAPAPGGNAKYEVTLRGVDAAGEIPLFARLVMAPTSLGLRYVPGEAEPRLGSAPRGVRAFEPGADVGGRALGAMPVETPALAPIREPLPPLWLEARRARGSAPVRLVVPMPDEPGAFELRVAAFLPDGSTLQRTAFIDLRGVVTIELSQPRHTLLGDRLPATLILRNPTGAEVEGNLTIQGGRGLTLLSLETGASDETGGRRRVRVPAGGESVSTAWFEASHAGRGATTLTFEAGDVRRRSVASYRVAPADSGAAADALRIRRRLYLLEEDPQEPQPDLLSTLGTPAPREEWLRIAMAPGARVRPGQRVLVQEVIDAPVNASALVWRQRAPANAHFCRAAEMDLSTVGRLDRATVDQLAYSSGQPVASQLMHEYVLVAVRAGVCGLPVPEVLVDGSARAVTVAPADLRVNVDETLVERP